MFSLTTSSPCEIQGTIVFKNDPKYRLGTHEDTEGVRWNIHGFLGGYIQAVREGGLNGYYKDTIVSSSVSAGDTSGASNFVQQSWLPYNYTWTGNPADE